MRCKLLKPTYITKKISSIGSRISAQDAPISANKPETDTQCRYNSLIPSFKTRISFNQLSVNIQQLHSSHPNIRNARLHL